MSDDTKKQLDAAISRIASLEAELRGKKPASPTAAGIDPRDLASDPIGALKRAGVPLDHVTKIIVAHAMGDQAPQQLREYAAMSQHTSAAQQALATEIQSLRQRVDTYEARDRKDAARKSLQALVADKQKYPTLSAALERDPSIFDEDIASGGDVAEIADKLETRLARVIGKPAAPAARQDNAEQNGQSNEAKASDAGNTASENKGNTSDNAAAKAAAGVGSATDVTPPPLPKPTSGGPLTPETAEELKQRILRKHGAAVDAQRAQQAGSNGAQGNRQ